MVLSHVDCNMAAAAPTVLANLVYYNRCPIMSFSKPPNIDPVDSPSAGSVVDRGPYALAIYTPATSAVLHSFPNEQALASHHHVKNKALDQSRILQRPSKPLRGLWTLNGLERSYLFAKAQSWCPTQ